MNNQQLSTPSFASEVFLAAGLALLAVVLVNAAATFGALSHLSVSMAWAGVLTGVYLLVLTLRGNRKPGRLTLYLVWALPAVVLYVLDANLLLQCGWHILAISATRTWLFYPSPLRFLADLTLSGMACAAALWTLSHSQSLLLTVWSFFLVQASWSWLHARTLVAKDAQQQRTFDAAQASATAAIRRMTRRQRV